MEKPRSPGLLQEIRDAVGKTPKKIRLLAQAGSLIMGQSMAEEHKAKAADLADAQQIEMESKTSERKETKDERRIEEQPKQRAEKKSEAEFEKQVDEILEGHPERFRLEFKKDFSTLSPEIIEKIVKSDAKIAQLVSGPEQFPDAEQLGGLAKSERATVYLNSQAYDANQGRYLWLKIANKIKPDREMPQGNA